MRLVFLARLYKPHGGGVERHVEELARVLKERKYKITIITEQYDPELKLKQKMDGVNILRIPYSALNSKFQVWKWMISNESLFKKADLIHVHDVFWWYMPLRFKLKDKPVYTTFHGYEGVGLPRIQAVIHRKLVEKLSRKTIIVGEFMRKWYKANPDKVIYGAANMKAARRRTTNSAVFVGRLAEDTGIMTYLRAIQLIKPEMSLDVYGDGPQLDEAKMHSKKQRLPVAFHGWNKQVDKLYKSSRYAFVSRYLSILEAMQTKRLVVAVYNNEIKKDYLRCHPMARNMIMAQNEEELERKFNELNLHDETRMIKNAHKWAKAQTWNKMADTYEALWKS